MELDRGRVDSDIAETKRNLCNLYKRKGFKLMVSAVAVLGTGT